MQWKEFTAEYDSWEKKEDLENAEEAVEELKERMNVEVRRQEKLNMAKERNFKKGELLGKFTAKMLYG